MITDDYGDEVHVCRYSDKLVWPDSARYVGATVPGVKARYVAAKDADSRPHFAAFHESEANCNTCRHLARTPHAKSSLGLLFGECQQGPRMFHPDDPMHMPCWGAR